MPGNCSGRWRVPPMPEPIVIRMAVTADYDGMWRLYRASRRRCWLPSSLLALLWTGLLAALIGRLSAQDDLLLLIGQVEELVSSSAFWRVLLAAACVSTWLSCAVIVLVHAVATGGSVGVGAAMARALRAFPAALAGAAIYVGLTSLGSLLLLVPGAYLWGMWQLWVVVLMIERTGPGNALGRSWALMRGIWWQGTALTTVATVAVVAAPLIVNGLMSIMGAVLGASAAQTPLIALAALGICLAALVPLLPAALVAIYVVQQRRQALAV